LGCALKQHRIPIVAHTSVTHSHRVRLSLV
jgi:hypothetical protein